MFTRRFFKTRRLLHLMMRDSFITSSRKIECSVRVQNHPVINEPSSASETINYFKLETKKGKKAEPSWKPFVLETLHNELQASKKSSLNAGKFRHSTALLIRYAVDDDILSIISFMDNLLKSYPLAVKKNLQFDQVLSICTILIQRNLEPFANGQNNPNDKLATSICYSFSNLLHRLRFFGSDTRISTLLLFDTFKRWSDLRADDEHSREIASFIADIKQKIIKSMSFIDMTESCLHLNQKDSEDLNRIAGFLGVRLKRLVRENHNYDPNLKLVTCLEKPCSDEDYLGNPFNISKIDREHYLKQLDNQMKLEESAFIQIKNVWSNNNKEAVSSAEDLIFKWQWKEKIAEQLENQRRNIALYPVKVLLEILDRDVLVESLLQAVSASCSLGQNLVPISIFQHNLTSPILRIINAKFLQKLGLNLKDVWRQVMAEYLIYFEDESIAQTHTHRHWWSKVCSRHKLSPDYEAPFAQIHSEMLNAMTVFLTNVVLDACKFPLEGSNKAGQLSPAFAIKNVALEEESRVNEEGRYSLTPMVHLSLNMMEQFERTGFRHLLFPTGELPMTVPPRPWVDKGVGGPEFSRSKEIIRKVCEYKMFDINKEMSERLRDSSQARPVFDALNQLGATPWVINAPMLDVLCKVFSMSKDSRNENFLNTLAVPLKASAVKIPTTEDIIGEIKDKSLVLKEQWKKYYKARAEAVKKRNEMNSLWCWMLYRVVLAQHFRGQILFFPHNMDFRGRVYPISPYLSHMGDDVNRCILKFAKGKPLGKNGLSWLKLHCINLTGKMKRQSIAERLQYAEEILPDILDSANNPLKGKRWWMESDEPWQTLAACMELRDAVNFSGDPADFISHLPIHQDGSCNGLQHYAALGRDKQGGSEVNLLPSMSPSDVYSSVAARVEQKRLQDEQFGDDQKLVNKLRIVLPQAVPRKLIKQTVMTTVYGVTMYGAVQQIKRQLKALNIDNDDTVKFASYLAIKTFSSLHDAFTSSMQLKDWFRSCAKAINELSRTVEWVTPLGLPVVQPYVRDKITKSFLILAPIPMKQVDAFPPNFVHSLDSTHMMLTSLECSRRGVTFAAVHDCFWTHACTVDTMNEICRQQFVNLHTQPLVEQLSDWFLEHYLPASLLSNMTNKEKNDFVEIFTPRVKAGNLDINDVKNSVYFFS